MVKRFGWFAVLATLGVLALPPAGSRASDVCPVDTLPTAYCVPGTSFTTVTQALATIRQNLAELTTTNPEVTVPVYTPGTLGVYVYATAQSMALQHGRRDRRHDRTHRHHEKHRPRKIILYLTTLDGTRSDVFTFKLHLTDAGRSLLNSLRGTHHRVLDLQVDVSFTPFAEETVVARGSVQSRVSLKRRKRPLSAPL